MYKSDRRLPVKVWYPPSSLRSLGGITLQVNNFWNSLWKNLKIINLVKSRSLFPPASAASWGVTKPLLVVSDHFCSLFNGIPITFVHFLTQLTSQICWLSENFPKIWRSAKRSSRTSLQNACGGILIFLFFHNRFLHNSLRDLPFFRKSQYWRF